MGLGSLRSRTSLSIRYGIGARVRLTSSSSDRADAPDYFPSFSGSRER
jgi:hypothetical protein